MAQPGNTQGKSSRALALARRKALSGSGKAALQSTSAASGGPSRVTAQSSQSTALATTPGRNANSSREASLARRRAMSTKGKSAVSSTVSSARGGPSRVVTQSSKPVPTQSAQSTVLPPMGKTVVAPRRYASSIDNGSRAASLARRRALSTKGKSAVTGGDRIRTMTNGLGAKSAAQPVTPATAGEGCGCGCNGANKDGCNTSANVKATTATSRISRSLLKRKPKKIVQSDSCRAGALARRKLLATRGKAGISKTGLSSAQAARATNPDLSSRELARTLRDQKSRKGSAGQKKSESPRRMRPARNADTGAAQDAPWKVGASSTTHGQTVTGTMVGRIQAVTGDEASTCRDVTGTEYMGADIFQQFCQAEPAKAVTRSGVSSTGLGNLVTGNQVGRSQKVTGDEPGTCKNVTGTEYVGTGQSVEFCGTDAPKKAPLTETATRKGKVVTGDNVGRSGKVTGDESGMSRELTGTQYTKPEDIGNAPRKVGKSTTLRGGNVTGTTVGRREKMTGDEPGSCRNITGDEYLGQEQYSEFCDTTPKPADQKVGVSPSLKGNAITGTMTGRSGIVTGDEPGTCKAVTGTPYAGLDQANTYCDASASTEIHARTRPLASTPGPAMTGQQPGIGGVMTGNSKGVCEPVTGTPYVGSDQFSDACPATPATPASPDFPQPLGQFSVTSPAGGAAQAAGDTGVTGNRYESRHNITGPFGMAGDKVTGTEEARFGNKAHSEELRPVVNEEQEGRVKSRVTGEGQDSGLKITGNDWGRNEHVTGTEGRSATRRNPTIRKGMVSAMQVEKKRNEELPVPSSKVTGGSGNTDKGSLITYSGGARG